MKSIDLFDKITLFDVNILGSDILVKDRIMKLRKVMKESGLDGVLLVGDVNRNYFSGFTGDESYSIITENKLIFITDSRFTEQAKKQVKDYEVLQYNNKIEDFISDIVEKYNIKNMGFEENVLTYEVYTGFKEALSCTLTPFGHKIEELRFVKDSSEIEKISHAAFIADKAFDHMLNFIKEGQTEREVGLELEFFMRKMGASGLSFPSIVASGLRSSLPHGQATDKKLEKGDFLTLDFGCIYDEYCSDMTRTVVIGSPTDKMKEIYNIVLETNEKVLQAIKPGKSTRKIDQKARDIISSYGYGECFGHGLGHSVGREIHEKPYLNRSTDSVLKSGMVVTDEPGIYIPGFGGVRIEDLVLVTEDGCEALSKSPKKLICL